jgi:hypothetical protein
MFRRFALVAALLSFVSLLSIDSAASAVAVVQAAVVAQSLPSLFSTESEAQAHCPRDTVVWLNIPSGIYHYKGERWYGRTKHGAYACEKGRPRRAIVQVKMDNNFRACTVDDGLQFGTVVSIANGRRQ